MTAKEHLLKNKYWKSVEKNGDLDGWIECITGWMESYVSEERKKYIYCPYCGNKLVHEIETDSNTKKVCKYSLCQKK